mmetsp:Transcript_11640/g.17457  ORF Transcript_11640/g.17457 Transcript_11640/m.17457 type:complete len:218 (+) Transcript_11640:673-1326(+)
MGSRNSCSEFTSLSNVLAYILVVSHEYFYACGFSLFLHCFELNNSGSTGLLKVDAFGSTSDRFGKKTWVISSSSTDESKTGCLRGRKISHGSCELYSIGSFPFSLAFLEVISSRSISSSSHEPGLNNVVKRSTWALLFNQLKTMVPSHTTVRSSTSNKHYFSLSFFSVRNNSSGESTHTSACGDSRTRNKSRSAASEEGSSGCEGHDGSTVVYVTGL